MADAIQRPQDSVSRLQATTTPPVKRPLVSVSMPIGFDPNQVLRGKDLVATAKVDREQIPLFYRISNAFWAFFRYQDGIKHLEDQGEAAIGKLGEADQLLRELEIEGASLAEFAVTGDSKGVGRIQNDKIDIPGYGSVALGTHIGNIASDLAYAQRDLTRALDVVDPGRQMVGSRNLRILEQVLKERCALVEGLHQLYLEKTRSSDFDQPLISGLKGNPNRAATVFVAEARRLSIRIATGKKVEPADILQIERLLSRAEVYRMLVAGGTPSKEAKQTIKQIFASYAASGEFKLAADELTRSSGSLLDKTLAPELAQQRKAAIAEAEKGKRVELTSLERFEINRRFVLLDQATNDSSNFAENYFQYSASERLTARMGSFVAIHGSAMKPDALYHLYQSHLDTELAILTALHKSHHIDNGELAQELANLYALDVPVVFDTLVAPFPSTVRKGMSKAFRAEASLGTRALRQAQVRRLMTNLLETEQGKDTVGLLLDNLSNPTTRAQELKTLPQAIDGTATGFLPELYKLHSEGRLTLINFGQKMKEAQGLPKKEQEVFDAIKQPLAIELLKREYGEEIALLYVLTGKGDFARFTKSLELNNSVIVSPVDPQGGASLETGQVKPASGVMYTTRLQEGLSRFAAASGEVQGKIVKQAMAFPEALSTVLEAFSVPLDRAQPLKKLSKDNLKRRLIVETQGLKGVRLQHKVATILMDFAADTEAAVVDFDITKDAGLGALSNQALSEAVQVVNLNPQDQQAIAKMIGPALTQIRRSWQS